MNFSILKAYPCKLPFEQRGIGDGYATSGPVTTYKLPPEEIKRIFAQAEKPREKPPIVFRDPRKRKDDDTVANRLEMAREREAKVNQAVKVDIEKREREPVKADIETINWADNPQECMDEMRRLNTNQVSVYEAITELDTITDEIEALTARADKIKDALKGVMVEI
jgi:seryl-tRNA synthetase